MNLLWLLLFLWIVNECIIIGFLKCYEFFLKNIINNGKINFIISWRGYILEKVFGNIYMVGN